MENSNTLKYKNKYCKCDKTHFTITKEGVYHKSVLFLKFTDDNERVNLLNMEEAGTDYLNDRWNFYMTLQD